MKEIDGSMLQRKGLLQQPGCAYLLKLYIRDETEVLKYTNWDRSLMFNGELYEPAPFTVGSFSQDKEGGTPEVNISVSNIDRVILPIIERYNAFRGCKCEIRTVFVDNLEYCVLDVFWINSIQATEHVVTFSLSSRLSIFDVKIPHNYYFKEYCLWIYKGTECAYTPFNYGTCDVTYGSDQVISKVINASWWYFDGCFRIAAGDIFKATGDTNIYDSTLEAGEIYVESVSYDSVLRETTATLVTPYLYNSNSRSTYTIRKLSCDNNYTACLEHNNLLRFGGFPGMLTSKTKYI